jgi:hypothetical protein
MCIGYTLDVARQMRPYGTNDIETTMKRTDA